MFPPKKYFKSQGGCKQLYLNKRCWDKVFGIALNLVSMRFHLKGRHLSLTHNSVGAWLKS